ncbi:MAG: hypothetical protein D6681_01815 [Calditrichaeota bacterium]|nr:MAG: hypothetical protein D6681_01815 [Calditrichota bacterium]
MAKINLFDTPETRHAGKEDSDTVEFESPGDELDFSFLQSEEAPPRTEPREPTPPPAQEPAAPNPFEVEEPFVAEEEPPIPFEAISPRRRFLPLIVIALILILLLALAYYLWKGPGEEKTSSEPPAAPVVEQPDKPAPTPAFPPFVKKQYTENTNFNRFYLNYLQNLSGVRAAGTGYRLLVVTSGHIYLTVIADSRDALAEFRRAVKAHYPGIQMELTSLGPLFEGGQEKLVADFAVPLPAGISGGASPSVGQVIPLTEARNALRSLARKHRLNVTRFNAGDVTTSGRLRKTPQYMEVVGAPQAVTAFLREAAQTIPAIRLVKVSLYPLNASTIGTQTKAKIELVIFTPNAL